jgi:octaprenyl-diphosphate synthase
MERVPDLRARLLTDEVDVLVCLVRDCGALELALDEARRRVDAAIGALDALPPSLHRDALVVLGRYLVERTA